MKRAEHPAKVRERTEGYCVVDCEVEYRAVVVQVLPVVKEDYVEEMPSAKLAMHWFLDHPQKVTSKEDSGVPKGQDLHFPINRRKVN